MEYSRVPSRVLSPERSLPEQRVAIESGGAATIFKRIFLYLEMLDEDPKRANLKLQTKLAMNKMRFSPLFVDRIQLKANYKS